ncbi:TetR/AcrR family transcriptional regulator, partial [Ruficoccus amylovorans]
MTPREQIGKQAEREYILHGKRGVTPKNLAHKMGVKLSALSQLFPTREDLILEVYRINVQEMNREREEALDRALVDSGGKPLSIESIMDARILPLARRCIEPHKGVQYQVGLSRFFTESSSIKNRILHEQFADLTQRFIDEIERALPYLPREEIRRRFQMTMAAMLGVCGILDMAAYGKEPARSEQEMWKMVHDLRDFLCEGFSAPVQDRHSPSSIHLNDGGRQWQVPLKDIACINADGDYSRVYYASGGCDMVRQTMKAWESIL